MPPFFGGNSRSGGIRWNPPLAQMKQIVQSLKDPIYDEVYNDLKPWVAALRVQAQTTRPWTDRTNKARTGLFAYRRRGASYMTLALTHGPRTVSEWHGSPFYYGVALETVVYSGADDLSVAELRARGHSEPEIESFATDNGKKLRSADSGGHGTYAIVMPTMEANYPAIMASFRGALERAIRKQL